MSKKSSIDYVRSMVICAMLTALSVLLTRFVSPQIGDAMRFSFGTIPIMLSGILFGPVYGFVVGVAADLVGFLINPMGSSFIIGLTVCSGLLGVVPAVLYNYVFKIKNTFTLGVSVLTAELVVSAVLKSACLMYAFGGTFLTWFLPKLLTAAVMAVTELIAIGVLLKVLHKAFKKYF